jgi:hypothetical protein
MKLNLSLIRYSNLNFYFNKKISPNAHVNGNTTSLKFNSTGTQI